MDEAEQAAADAAISGKSSAPAAGAAPKPPRAAVEELGFAPEAEREKAPAKPAAQEPPPLLLQVRPRGPVDDPLREAIVANRAATEATFTRNQRRSRQQTTTLVTVILLGLAVILGVVFLVVFIGPPASSPNSETKAGPSTPQGMEKGMPFVIDPFQSGKVEPTIDSTKIDQEVVQKDLEAMQGEWALVFGGINGHPIHQGDLSKYRRVCTGNEVTEWEDDKIIRHVRMVIDPSKHPKQVDCENLLDPRFKDDIRLGIYELNGDTLKECYATEIAHGSRPTSFRPQDVPGPGGYNRVYGLCEWKRVSR